MKFDEDPELEKLVEEMMGTEVEEFSIVDQPATGKPFVMFKRLETLGGGTRMADKTDLANFKALLVEFAKAVPEGVDRATFERCLGDVMDKIDKGEITPQDGQDPKSTAFAICTAGGAGAGKAAKADPLAPADGMPIDGMPAAPGDGAAADTVEIPASPKKWSFSNCLDDAMTAGFDQDSSIALCQVLRQDFGDPSDPETILVPDGSSPEAMLASAAVHGGMARPEGLSAPPPDQVLKFSGKNQWLRKFRRYLGIDRPPPAEDRAIVRLRQEVRKIMAEQVKTKQDLRDMIALQRDLVEGLLRSMGVEVKLPGAATAPAEPAGTVAAALTPAAAVVAEADPTKRIKELEAEVARLKAGAAKPGTKATDEDAGDDEPVMPEEMVVPHAASAPVLVDLERAAGARSPLLRKSVDPRAGAKGVAGAVPDGELEYSTYLNAWIPKGDREAMVKRFEAAGRAH